MSERTTRIEGLIQEAAAKFVLHEANTDPMITITRADISPDLSRVLIFFTTIPDGKEEGAHIFLKRNASALRNYLKSHARLKKIPHIEFMVDAGERHRQHIDEMVRDLEKEKDSK